MLQLNIEGLSKTYPNGVRALDNVTLTIPTGMFGLLGPNGAGKSTLMRTLATLQEADAGSARLGSIDVLRQKDDVRKLLGYLPQEFGVYPKIAAETMLSHFAVLKGITNAARARKRSMRCSIASTSGTCASSASARSPAACASASALPRRCSATRS